MELTLNNVTKTYNGKIILDKVSVKAKNCNVIALIGPSGSGKSTLLRLIAGLENFQEGEIILNGKYIDDKNIENRKKVGFVFQDHNLFNHLSIEENIYLVLEKVHKEKRSKVEEKVNDLLNKFGLLEHKNKKPHEISGGQAQRASIVRALAINPEIILLDEPTSALDPILTYEVLSAIRKLVDEEKQVILVTHEIGFAKHVSDYIIYMEDGNIVESGGKEIFSDPSSEGLKKFLNKVLSYK